MKDPKIIQIVFNLVKAKIKNESLILTPNLMRFLALKLINNDQTLIVKLGNILASSENRARLFARVLGSGAIELLGALFSILPYAIFMMVVYFDSTENWGYTCSNYFDELPDKEGPVKVYSEKSTGHLLIGSNDKAKQVEIYNPANAVTTTTSQGSVKIKTTLQKSS